MCNNTHCAKYVNIIVGSDNNSLVWSPENRAPHSSNVISNINAMKEYKYSKIKIIYDFISTIIFIAVINFCIDLLFGHPNIFNSTELILNVIFISILMALIFPPFFFALPTIISISFSSDCLVIRHVIGHKPKNISYKDLKRLEKSGIGPNNYRLWYKKEKVR
mgnify:CR=1 FL=1